MSVRVQHFLIVVLIIKELGKAPSSRLHAFGLQFLYKTYSTRIRISFLLGPVNGYFSALPFIYGTLVSSFLPLLIAVPLALGVAIFLTEMCPGSLRGPLAFLTELLAAIPSIIYGFWPAPYVLFPLLREHVNPVLVNFWAGRDSSKTTTPPA